MSEPSGSDQAEEEVHASWIELFFDLVAVAGVATLAHVLVSDHTAEALGLYVVLFLAFWMSWTSFMLYGNVRAGQADVIRILIGMFGIGVMSASVPGVAHAVLDGTHHLAALDVFAVTYFVVRLLGARSFDGSVVLDFPVVQHTLGAVPWLVSVWVDDVTVIVVLWSVGLLIDAAGVVLVSSERMLEEAEERYRAVERRVAGHPEEQHERVQARLARFRVEPVTGSREHLAERLGLFVIIVLGEGVVQLVHAASEDEPTRGLFLSGLVSFALLAGLFGLSVRYGHAGVPHLRPESLPVRFALGAHGLVSAILAGLAVSLAGVVEHGREPLSDEQRWLLCGCLAAYFVVGLAAMLASRRSLRRWSLATIATGVLLPIALAVLGADLGATGLTALLLAGVLVHVAGEVRAGRASGPEQPAA